MSAFRMETLKADNPFERLGSLGSEHMCVVERTPRICSPPVLRPRPRRRWLLSTSEDGTRRKVRACRISIASIRPNSLSTIDGIAGSGPTGAQTAHALPIVFGRNEIACHEPRVGRAGSKASSKQPMSPGADRVSMGRLSSPPSAG